MGRAEQHSACERRWCGVATLAFIGKRGRCRPSCRSVDLGCEILRSATCAALAEEMDRQRFLLTATGWRSLAARLRLRHPPSPVASSAQSGRAPCTRPMRMKLPEPAAAIFHSGLLTEGTSLFLRMARPRRRSVTHFIAGSCRNAVIKRSRICRGCSIR
jgi:hypothetical protein